MKSCGRTVTDAIAVLVMAVVNTPLAAIVPTPLIDTLYCPTVVLGRRIPPLKVASKLLGIAIVAEFAVVQVVVPKHVTNGGVDTGLAVLVTETEPV